MLVSNNNQVVMFARRDVFGGKQQNKKLSESTRQPVRRI
jgi:hypothetical protein